MSNKYEPGVWYEWSGGENPVPGMQVDYRLCEDSLYRGELSDDLDWSEAIDIHGENIIAFRPALSPPAEGVAHLTAAERAYGEERAASMLNTYPTPTPAPVDWESPPADPPTPEMQALMQRYQANQSAVAVDWERVGPKLVEAVEKARDHYDMMTRLANGGVVYEVNPETRKRIRRKLSEVIATEADAGSKHCRAALAAAQPEEK